MVKSKVFWGIVTAAAAGAVIGMLFATEEGTKIRKKIKKRTNSLAEELIDALEKSKAKASDVADDLKAKGEKYKGEALDKAEALAADAETEISRYN